MRAIDFEYDGLRLSDKGFMICEFDGGGLDTITNGSEITFNTVSTLKGAKHELTSVEYADCLTATLQICKNLCADTNEEIDIEDARDIMRWLNRKSFHKFKLVDDEYTGIYFEASFNVSRIEISGRLYGFELEMFTNRPFAIGDLVEITIDNEKPNVVRSFFSKSDQEGCIYPDNMTITLKEAGDLEIYSLTEDRTMKIKNCENNEVITINYPLISSSSSSHSKTIMNDFNWIFHRVSSTFKNRKNEFTASLPCTIKIKYSPIVKVGI